MKQEDPIQLAAREMQLITGEARAAAGREELIFRINELIDKEFQKLISILYRMDVSEAKVRVLLNDNPGADAGVLIADLMIGRQVEKIKSRQQFSKRDNNIDEEEKW